MKKQMVKNILGLTITLSFFYIVSVWARETKTEAIISVTHCSGGSTLSINADKVTLGKILNELAEKCTIKVVIYDKTILARPINLSFKDVSINQGIKKILQEAGITNHLITYRNNSTNRSGISEVILLGNSRKGEERIAIEGKRGGAASFYGDARLEDTLREKIESFKARYNWEEGETGELAKYLLTVMPIGIRKPGLDKLIRALDRRIKEGNEDTVDEELLFQAIGETVPPHLEPFMMETIKNYSRSYKSGKDINSPERLPNQRYQDFMKAHQSERGDY